MFEYYLKNKNLYTQTNHLFLFFLTIIFNFEAKKKKIKINK